MLSSKNKSITVKVSKDTYDFINTFSKKYNVSVSSFCQDCITQSILIHDKNANNCTKYSTSDGYYRNLAWFISETYDDRRKK